MLIGHEKQKAAFAEALGGRRVHHAWLLTGPKGIGKRRFAEWATEKLLGEGAPPLLEAGSHPDHRLLTPPVEGKGSATSSIPVDQVRALGEFLHSYPAIAPYRTLIVDAADDMNINAANAFLKELEEPRGQTVFFLISHAPARLLPTIRSRCRTLRFFPLSDEEVTTALMQATPELSAGDAMELAQIASGAPGAVADLAGTDLKGLEKELGLIARGGDPMPLARSVQAQSAVARFQALLAMVPRELAARARKGDPRLIDLYSEAELLAKDAIRLAYDKGEVAMALADIMARAGRIQEQDPAR